MSVLSQISNCQSLGRKNKHEILKTDRTYTHSCMDLSARTKEVNFLSAPSNFLAQWFRNFDSKILGLTILSMKMAVHTCIPSWISPHAKKLDGALRKPTSFVQEFVWLEFQNYRFLVWKLAVTQDNKHRFHLTTTTVIITSITIITIIIIITIVICIPSWN